ncbi:aminotransferase [Byssothecium circinans]|uniref:Aminotransferase n=1 Tax=Byssothecium circinans TaxID=147558 RepID=A0A6A5TBF2_9PLEO|nr:aminotransferase [Byssothecium circinans]
MSSLKRAAHPAPAATPLAISASRTISSKLTATTHKSSGGRSALLPRNFRKPATEIIRASGHYLYTQDGRWLYDACGGASVSCFGPGPNERVKAASRAQEDAVSYVCSYSCETPISKAYANALVDTTWGQMVKAVFYNSGSEAVEAALKMVLQYFQGLGQPNRKIFIAREQSYHGTTLGALSLGGHRARRDPFESVLMYCERVEPCNAWRNKAKDESDSAYLARLKEDMRATFIAAGPENIAGVIVEPVVGAALGCVPAVPGYLKALRELCDEYGALLIFDEVMCGMGRLGTNLHAWQNERVVPDIQVIGKGMAGGYKPISGVLIGKKAGVLDVLETDGYFNHGHTFQNSPEACAAGLEVLKIILEGTLLENVREKGELLRRKLKDRLKDCPHVGDIRGDGLFIGVEFVLDKLTKTPFNPIDSVASEIHYMGMEKFLLQVYPGTGSADGKSGDHVIISPAYDVTEVDVNLIVERFGNLVDHFFATFTPTAEKV